MLLNDYLEIEEVFAKDMTEERLRQDMRWAIAVAAVTPEGCMHSAARRLSTAIGVLEGMVRELKAELGEHY